MVAQTIKFKITAADTARGVLKVSNEMAIIVDPLQNLYAPEIQAIPDVEMSVNQSKLIEIPAPTDRDGVTPVIKSLSVSGVGSEFIFLNSGLR